MIGVATTVADTFVDRAGRTAGHPDHPCQPGDGLLDEDVAGRQTRPAARARATTCIDKMLSPPRSKKDSSTPTRSSPST